MPDLARIAALMSAPPDPCDHDACLAYRRELERAGFVALWDGEVEDGGSYEDWRRKRLEECKNGD